MRTLVASTLAALSLLATTASALTATQSVEKETLITNPDGTQTTVLSPAETVSPGERVVYSLDFTNDGAAPASDLVLTMPVPGEVTYVEGSSDMDGAVVAVSTDGGVTFGPRAQANVIRDGRVERAGASDITHLRWTVAGPVAPGASDRLSFKAVLN